MPGGHIILLEDTRNRLTNQQAEIVAVGAPEFCPEPTECERPHTTKGVRLVHVIDPRIIPGAWVLCAKWAYVGIRDDLYAVRHSDIIGVFTEAPTTTLRDPPLPSAANRRPAPAR